jgi:hypothetical protein
LFWRRPHAECDYGGHIGQRIEAMKGQSRPFARPWMLPVGVVVLIAGPVILYYVLSRAGLATAMVSGVIILMVIKHLGLLAVLLGPLYAMFRRRSGIRSCGGRKRI